MTDLIGRKGCQLRRCSRGCAAMAPGTIPPSFGRTKVTRGG